MDKVEVDVEDIGFAIGAMHDVGVPKLLREGSRGHVLLLFGRLRRAGGDRPRTVRFVSQIMRR
jgi:hypothetical protein